MKLSEGFVELPYTLVQDFNLFTVLQERDTSIWEQKLAWIAGKGGMALLDTHPDYMTLPGTAAARGEFPMEWYAQFLKTIRAQWAGQFWHPLPRDMARFARGVFQPVSASASGTAAGTAPAPAAPVAPDRGLAGRRVAVVLYSYYPADPRPRRAAEALVRAGMQVELLCLRETAGEPAQETVNGVAVTRVPMKRRRAGKLTYGIQYLLFGLAAWSRLGWRSLSRRYDLVHVHNMPDALVFSALFPRLRGARVILDLHDPMPELMMSIYHLKRESRAVRVLTRVEKWSTGFADVVLTVNEACRQIFTARSCPPGKVRVVMNAPDEEAFTLLPPAERGPDRRNGAARPFVLMYHGSLVERHGLDLAVNAVARLRETLPHLELRVYGQSTAFLEQVMAGVRERGWGNFVTYLGPKSVQQIADAIVECDLGIVPNRRSLFTEINTPTRIFEYLSRGRPVIAPRAPGIQDYFREDELVYFKLGDQDDLEQQIRFVVAEPERVRTIVEAGQKVYLEHSWSRERARFLDTVAELVVR